MSRLTVKGQVTIPKKIRQVLGVESGDRVEFEVLADRRVVVKRALADRVFEPYVGYLAEKSGEDPDNIIESLREDV